MNDSVAKIGIGFLKLTETAVKLSRSTSLQILFISGIGGAFGGLVSSVLPNHANHTNQISLFGGVYSLGAFGDCLVGAAAGIVILLVTMSSDNQTSSPNYLRVFPMGLLAGIAGSALLLKLVDNQFGSLNSKLDAVQSQIAAAPQVSDLLKEALERYDFKPGPGQEAPVNTLEKLGYLKQSEGLLSRAISLNPSNSVPYLYLAKVFRRDADLDPNEKREFMQRAIDQLSTAIQINPDYDRAYYNRACYRVISGGDGSAAVADLKKAIELAPENKVAALTDTDLYSITNQPSFQSLFK